MVVFIEYILLDGIEIYVFEVIGEIDVGDIYVSICVVEYCFVEGFEFSGGILGFEFFDFGIGWKFLEYVVFGFDIEFFVFEFFVCFWFVVFFLFEEVIDRCVSVGVGKCCFFEIVEYMKLLK